MSTVVDAVHNGVQAHVFAPSAPIRIALLGVGQVGGALAGLLQEPALSRRFNLSSGLVRDLARPRPHATGVPLTATLSQALGENPDVVVEVLGGLEPARTLILQAIERRIPVVTANKSLLAAHGDELLDAASTGGVPLRYEAAVLAGVPFLGTFANRSLARDITGVCGIVNGTTNFILSEMFEHRTDFATALAEAKRRGYAEPNPANDVNGVDAVEKLCVLLRHFGDWSVAPASISVEGIDRPANGRSDTQPANSTAFSNRSCRRTGTTTNCRRSPDRRSSPCRISWHGSTAFRMPCCCGTGRPATCFLPAPAPDRPSRRRRSWTM